MSCGVGCRCGSDPTLLWLWRRPVAVALIQPLAWESSYAASAVLKSQKKKKSKRKRKRNKSGSRVMCVVPCCFWFCFFCWFVFSFLATLWHMEFLGQGSDPSPSLGLSCGCGNAGSSTHCAGPGVEPATQSSPKATDPIAPQWELQTFFFFKAIYKKRENCFLRFLTFKRI